MCNHTKARGACDDFFFSLSYPFLGGLVALGGDFVAADAIIFLEVEGGWVGLSLDYTTALALCARDLP